ncbi:MAG: T9SS type A sorting domain-containing protein [Flavobacteriales bacterium]|nr:T9SS type A sorting domain-containing protein [Flavobacteriales bacterium]
MMKRLRSISMLAVAFLGWQAGAYAQPYCDAAQGSPGFPSDPVCEASVCGYDGYCCSTSWDGYCAGEAATDGACTGCLASAPPNDDCALATVIGDGASPFNNTGATGTDITSCTYSDTKDIWYEYVASCTGTTTVTTVGGTAMDTGLSAWDACGGSELACNDDDLGCGCGQSTITFATVSGTSYWIRLAGYSDGTGSGTFTVSCAGPAVYCDMAQGSPGFPSDPACEASVCGGDSYCCSTLWDATCAAEAAIDGACTGCLSAPPPGPCMVDLYGEYPFGAVTPVCDGLANNVSGCGYPGEYTTLNLTSGTTYTFTSSIGTDWITISDNTGTVGFAFGLGPVVFMAPATDTYRFWIHSDAACGTAGSCRERRVACLGGPPPPANDDCASATVIGDGVSPFDNTGATGTDISSCCYSDTKDIWYEYVASCTGTTTVTTVGGTAMDTGLSAWDACGGSEIVCNDDDGGLQSTITFATVSGTSYWIRLAGYSGSTGSGTFTVSCAPAVPCTNDLVMELQTDTWGGETSWEVVPAGGGAALCGGGPGIYPGNAIYPIACCLPDGCYELHVYDTFGDGMSYGGFTGGYTLRMLSGQRIIDNRNNYGDFAAGSSYESTMSATPGFCLPMGNDRLISFSCDRLDLRRGVGPNSCSDKITADNTPNGTSGNVYQFWFYDPNGGLSFRYPASGPGSNQVSMANLPSLVEGTLYNVRVRTRISPGVWREWGNACRMMIDNTRGQCKLSGLVDEVGNSNYCCGKTITLPVGNQGNGFANHVVAWPAVRFNNNCVNSTANKYQFRFRIPAEAVTIVLNSPTNVKYMTAGAGFANCKTYTVEVRASFDNGYSWCVGGDPYGDLTPWGKVCEVYTSCPPPAVGGNQNMATDDGAAMHMYPNPNRGDQLYLSLDAIQEGVQTVSVDIYDTFGKRVSARTLAVQDGFINSVLELNGELAGGLYMVNITAGDAVYTERLVIQK